MDPSGVLYFETVTELPDPLVPQTAYIIDGQYYVDGEQVDLRISDDKINEWLGEYEATTDSVTLKALKFCRFYLVQELAVVKTASGADSDQYQDILSMKAMYDAQIQDLEDDIADSKVVKGSRRYQRFNDPCWLKDV